MSANPAGSRFFVVYHQAKPGHEDKFWSNIAAMMADGGAKMKEMNADLNAKGFHNAAFLPCSKTQIYCTWEMKKGKTTDELQEVLDKVVTGGCLVNCLNEVQCDMLGGAPYEPFFKE